MTPSDTAHPEGEREPHDLKTWPGPFADVMAGRKPFEYRFNDRDYREGDTLRLREWSPDSGAYTGETLQRGVGYVLAGGQFGIPPGYVIMALVPPSRPQGEEGLREDRDRLASALREMLRLSDMGFEAAMAEPEENGCYVAYTKAKAALAISNQGKPSS